MYRRTVIICSSNTIFKRIEAFYNEIARYGKQPQFHRSQTAPVPQQHFAMLTASMMSVAPAPDKARAN